MRKHLFFLLGTACMGATMLQAQNWVNGGNTLAANGTLGTNSNFSLIFETNNTDRGRITNGGNWAIGSTGTSSKLTVNSAASVSPLRAQIAGTTKFVVNGNGSTSIGSSTTGPANGLYVAGSVGIGTATPTYKLHVAGNTLITNGLYVSAGGISALASSTAISGTSSGSYGVYGSSSNYFGVLGSSSNSSGVYGSSNSNYGVQGYSSSAIGIYGQSGAAFNAGMYGVSPYIGVQGVSSGSDANRQAVRGDNNGSTTGYAGYFFGRVWVNGTLIKNAGSFKIDHPLDPAHKFLSHSFVESPDMKNIYDGVVTTDQSGKANVVLPDYFEALNKEFRYQLTPIGRFAKAIISKEISNNQFEIQTNKKAVRVAWQVTGIRKDAYAEAHRISVEEPKQGADIGKYIFPEGFGQPESERLDIARPQQDLRATKGSPDLVVGSFTDDSPLKGSYQPSDRQLKQNIKDLAAAITLINKLQPKEFEFRQDENYKALNLPKGKQYGLIAQDVELVLPDLVRQNELRTGGVVPAGATPLQSTPTLNSTTAPNTTPSPNMTKEEKTEVINFKAVNYTELIPIIVKALQELNQENEELKTKVADVELLKKENADIKNQLAELRALLKGGNTSVKIPAAMLAQSSPNPARGTTTIRYRIPEGTTSAKLTLTNSKGQMLKEINLNSRGTGYLNLNTTAFPAGLYTYSLWVDGRETTSKQLVIAR